MSKLVRKKPLIHLYLFLEKPRCPCLLFTSQWTTPELHNARHGALLLASRITGSLDQGRPSSQQPSLTALTPEGTPP